MGIVYEGRDPNLDRRVAIKTVKVENLSEEAAAEYEHRFRTEARSAARLQHPNIVSVYDSDRDGDVAFLVMEYIQGDDLKHHLDKGARYTLEQSLKMVRDLLSALDYAHQQGIVHRDIKPANLLIEPGGRLKLTDFGVARMQDSGEATRTQGSIIGTLKYMAPEQVQGQKTDSRADLFSAGVVLYQLLTDQRPFDGDNDFSIIHQIIGHHPPAPSSVNPKLPGAVDAVVARALAKNRDERFATARDFSMALQSAIRRAEDVTVIPAANPFKQMETAGVVSRSSPSAVTQEVELVYWKDIKDSTEPQDFEGFLEKFPAGIYADLARRRLRKLTHGSTSPDQTVLSGLPAEKAQPHRDVTRMPGAAHEADATGTPSGFPNTVIFGDEGESAPSGSEPTLPHGRPFAPGASPAVARRKPSVAAVAGMAVLLVTGAAAFALMGRGSSAPRDGVATMPAASAASAASTASAAPAEVPAASATPAATQTASTGEPVIAASQAKPSHGPAAARTGKARDAKPKAVASAPPPVAAPEPERSIAARPPAAPVAAAPAPSHAHEAFRPAPVAPTAASSAVEACKERMFLSRELCLDEACAKPGARNHPLCVQWREDKRLRDNSRVREGG